MDESSNNQKALLVEVETSATNATEKSIFALRLNGYAGRIIGVTYAFLRAAGRVAADRNDDEGTCYYRENDWFVGMDDIRQMVETVLPLEASGDASSKDIFSTGADVESFLFQNEAHETIQFVSVDLISGWILQKYRRQSQNPKNIQLLKENVIALLCQQWTIDEYIARHTSRNTRVVDDSYPILPLTGAVESMIVKPCTSSYVPVLNLSLATDYQLVFHQAAKNVDDKGDEFTAALRSVTNVNNSP
jgi:major membrane immunogen (membrane-anchored lipoprotein)